jgi:HEAT repeat protein
MPADLGALALQLADKDAAVRGAAAEQLARLGSEARSCAVQLAKAAGDAKSEVRDWAVAALEDLGPPLKSHVEDLAALAGDALPDTAYWAATLLGRLKADAASAVTALGRSLEKHKDIAVRQRAAWALGEIGPAAGPALGALQAAAKESDPRLARLAKTAIEAIHRKS